MSYYFLRSLGREKMLPKEQKIIKIIFSAILGLSIAQTSAFAKSEKLPTNSILDDEQDLTKIERLIINSSDFPTNSKIIFPGILIEGNYAVAEWQTEKMEGTMYLEKNNNKWEIIGVGFADMDYLKAIGMPSKEAKTIINYMYPQFEPDTNLQ